MRELSSAPDPIMIGPKKPHTIVASITYVEHPTTASQMRLNRICLSAKCFMESHKETK